MQTPTNRLSSFSDGVFAIIITIIVLGISFPNTFDGAHIRPFLWEIFIFAESSLAVGSFWYEHSKIFDRHEYVSVSDTLLNILCLITLSLVPLFTRGIMQHPDAKFPVIGFGIIIFLGNLIYGVVSLKFKYEFKYNKRIRVIYAPAFIVVNIFIAFWSPRISALLFMLLPAAWWGLGIFVDNKLENKSVNI